MAALFSTIALDNYSRSNGGVNTNSFKTVFDSKPYGDEHLEEKTECVGHVQQKMGARLRKLQANMSGVTLADGKKIGEKGRLTSTLIDST